VLESKALASTIFTSLYGHVAAVDRDGVIIAVNESWTRFARENGGDPARASVGTSYLQILAGRESAVADLDARRALEAVEAVLGAESVKLCSSTRAHQAKARAGSRWRWSRSGGPKAVPSSLTSTSRCAGGRRKRPGRQRDELAHALRVTTMGELAGSLAHEINQPLAVIVTSAQAAQRLLDGDLRTVPSFAAR
jgi:signal transduction histidine kinase